MDRNKSVTLGYILTFWGILPGFLAALAAWGERAFGPRLRLPNILPAALLLAAASGFMLALSIVQYTRASGGLPISAFPPRQLIRSGVFGIWRHPIYLFSVFFLSGLAMVFWPAGAILVVFPSLALGAFIYARLEEGGLKKRFDSVYDGHRRQTSVLIPRLPYLVRPLFFVLSRSYFRFEISGRENGALPPPFVVISTHRSFLDPVFISLALKVPVHFITTFEMFRNPVSRFVFSRLLSLPKKRYKPDVRNALDIRRRLLEGCAVGIFPEAERSWTGGMIGFKPEVLKLLLRHSDIPILPLRLEGTYSAWPRWRRRPRRGRVSVVIEKPVFTTRAESPAELEARLSRLVEPRPAPDPSPRPVAAGGIEALIYRCPECLRYDAVRSGKGPDFKCSNCLAGFRLFSDLTIQTSGTGVRTSVQAVCRRTRVASESDISISASGGIRARAKLAVEKLGRFESVGAGILDLSESRLSFESVSDPVRIDLEAIRSVVVEGARRLQVYGERPTRLFQFSLLDQSALKWQDLVAGAVRSRRGVSPSTA
jgi:1-acyl-sn-glycerol-3-phosphate acyltransferase